MDDNVASTVTADNQNDSRDNFSELFRKLATDLRARDNGDSSFAYLVLLQYSLHTQLRLAAVSSRSSSSSRSRSSTDENVYRRAGLRTPSENAWRDLQGQAWIRRLTETLCREYSSVMLVRTLTKRRPKWTMELPSNVHIIDLATDPFGWNQSESSRGDDATDNQPTMNLNDFNWLLEYLLKRREAASDDTSSKRPPGRMPLVLQSLSPILQRHGFARTYLFLQKLSFAFCPLVVPVCIESLEVEQHAQLEELAQAYLYLNGGDATLIRRGIRERANVVRESFTFEVPAPNSKDPGRIQLVRNATTTESKQSTTKHDSPSLNGAAPDLKGLSLRETTTSMDQHQSSTRKGAGVHPKVALALTDDDAPRTPSLPIVPPTVASDAPTPRIIIQEDDPEYHDYDEEDPDDDLDI